MAQEEPMINGKLRLGWRDLVWLGTIVAAGAVAYGALRAQTSAMDVRLTAVERRSEELADSVTAMLVDIRQDIAELRTSIDWIRREITR